MAVFWILFIIFIILLICPTKQDDDKEVYFLYRRIMLKCELHDWETKGEGDNKYMRCKKCKYLPETDSWDYYNKD